MAPLSGQVLGAGLPSLQPGLVTPTPLSATIPNEVQSSIKDIPVDTSIEDEYVLNPEAILENQDLGQPSSSSNEPKTYATLLKSGGGSGVYPIQANNGVFIQPLKALSPPVSTELQSFVLFDKLS